MAKQRRSQRGASAGENQKCDLSAGGAERGLSWGLLEYLLKCYFCQLSWPKLCYNILLYLSHLIARINRVFSGAYDSPSVCVYVCVELIR